MAIANLSARFCEDDRLSLARQGGRSVLEQGGGGCAGRTGAEPGHLAFERPYRRRIRKTRRSGSLCGSCKRGVGC